MAGDLRGFTRRQIRTLFDVGTATGLTDGQLLERFATRRDEGSELAFAVLVERHGPMVLRACRGILRDDHEAMDVFQATFLVLARKGGSLWVQDSLGPWLHRVACHAAGRAKRTASRRQATEKQAAELARSRNGGEDREELASVIHEEVDRLPERYRSAVVLCDLEGRTCEEAARHLGCPVGTVGSRLSRGRQRLRDRLTQRGLAPRACLPAGLAVWPGVAREPIPSALVGSTAGAAARFVSIRAAAQGTAASLALGVLRSMAMTRWWKMASVLLAVGASTTGVVSLVGRDVAVAQAPPDNTPKAARAEGFAVTEVKPGKLRVAVEERGNLEAARTSDVYCAVQGQTKVLSILPEGTRVTKGQLVCELDPGFLKSQMSPVQKFEAAYEDAKRVREVAEIAVKEYLNGIYPKDLQAASSEIALAESSVTRAEERLKRTRTAHERVNAMLAGQGGTKTPADVLAALEVEDRLAAAEQSLEQGRRALEVGRANRDVLEKFTKDKIVKQLQMDLDRARSVESARQLSCELERGNEAKLLRQIADCKLFAPADGIVIYANGPPGRVRGPNGLEVHAGPNGVLGMTKSWIEEGAFVHERQKIFSIPDIRHMQVNTKVHESLIDQIKPGQTARITVDAFPDETFLGVVETVTPLLDPPTLFNDDVKVYTTKVAISKGSLNLRPGMTARVEILVAALDNVLTVPVAAVVQYDKKYHVAVKTPGGGVEWREVTLGLTNEQAVEVKEGLKSGDTVVLEPGPLLNEEQKQKVSRSKPGAPGPGAVRWRNSKGKAPGTSPSFRTKWLALPPQDRLKLKDASPEDGAAFLKKAGFTDDEVRQYNHVRQRTGAPR